MNNKTVLTVVAVCFVRWVWMTNYRTWRHRQRIDRIEKTLTNLVR